MTSSTQAQIISLTWPSNWDAFGWLVRTDPLECKYIESTFNHKIYSWKRLSENVDISYSVIFLFCNKSASTSPTTGPIWTVNINLIDLNQASSLENEKIRKSCEDPRKKVPKIQELKIVSEI